MIKPKINTELQFVRLFPLQVWIGKSIRLQARYVLIGNAGIRGIISTYKLVVPKLIISSSTVTGFNFSQNLRNLHYHV